MPQPPSTEALLDLKGQKISVVELLGLFGTRVRNDHTILLISQALKDVGLSTLPYFANCGNGADIHVVPLESVAPTVPDEPDEDDGLSRGALPQQAFRIGDILSVDKGLDSVLPSTPLTQVTYLMRTMNYSQVPVIDGQSTLCGTVTWSSVAKMYETNAEPLLANAMVTDPPVAEEHQDFFSLLPMVSEFGYLLVRGNHGRFTGIVTASDIADRFNATAWPFFVIGEIEFRLRKCLGSKIDTEAIRAVQRYEKTGQIADLMFGDYVRLLKADQDREALRVRADQNWKALGWSGVDRAQFVHQLDRVRRIRNKVAHFDPEPLSAKLSGELRQFVNLLRQLT